MMRPSHPISTSLKSQPAARRITAAGLVVLVQMTVVWALVSGLAMQLAKPFHPLEYVPVAENVKPTPPPVPHIRDVTPPEVAPPVVILAPEPDRETSIAVPPQPLPPAVVKPQVPPVQVTPDRAASAIAANQTIPPYPAIAQRLGAEGTVTLRLTVLADGSVGKAEIVTSSGRHDLDETAQQWIVAHWTYKPAIRNGAPESSQVLAAVRFTLKDAQ